MNKEYIKRQITLDKLGIPMDRDIREYYDYFTQLVGDINNIEELTHNNYLDMVFWRKDGEIILKYEKNNNHFWVSGNMWKCFEDKYKLTYEESMILLNCFCGEVFGKENTITESGYPCPLYRFNDEGLIQIK